MPDSQNTYTIGVMKTPVESKPQPEFEGVVDKAAKQFKALLGEGLRLRVNVFEFTGPHLSPVSGAYSALDFLSLAVSEKLERGMNFLLLITEVDLLASTLSYTLALPSQLTNIGVISTRRLTPSFWGEDPNPEVTASRLTSLMLHTFGHLLNLPHDPNPTNVMYDIKAVEDLDSMRGFTPDQIETIRLVIPCEAHEHISHRSFWRFTLIQIFHNWDAILRAALRSNPFRLITRLPTMLAAAISVIIALFFTPEPWDVGSSVKTYQLVIFALISIVVATLVLYSAFKLDTIMSRNRTYAESTIITGVATLLSLFLTMVILFALFLTLIYLTAVTIFPRILMETWPTTQPAITVMDHVRLGLFLASIGLLAGSLGGRSDSKQVIRSVLFLDEET
jgi:predicted Zn-dependent protease